MASERVTLSDVNAHWHSAFCAAAELGLSENKEDLEFHREYNLSMEPLRIDLLVIEKRDDVQITNEIGRIFKRHNVLEYKSPGDHLSKAEFLKAVGYACIYQSLGDNADEIPAEQVTVSLFRNEKPVELLKYLERCGYKVEEKYKNIYYVEGFFFPIQIVVTREIEGEENRGLRILSRNALEEDIRAFINEAKEYTTKWARERVDAILQVSIQANFETYNEMRRRDPIMCEAMRTLMKDDIVKAQEEGMKEGRMEQAKEMALSLANMGISVDKIAEAAKVSLETVQKWLAGNMSVAK